jgi:hypothetical protein
VGFMKVRPIATNNTNDHEYNRPLKIFVFISVIRGKYSCLLVFISVIRG